MLISIGKVERIIAGKLYRVCACCGLTLDNCACQHDTTCFDTSCPMRHVSR